MSEDNKNITMLRDTRLAELLTETALGDHIAFKHLYEASSAKLFGVIRRICSTEDAAQEVLQDTYLLIWRNAASFNPKVASAMTWMTRVARNKAIDMRRLQSEKVSSLGVELDMEMPSTELDTYAITERNDTLRRLLDCLGLLGDDRKDIVLLAYMKGLTRDEIATRFSRPVNTVKTLLRRSLAQLKECIDGYT